MALTHKKGESLNGSWFQRKRHFVTFILRIFLRYVSETKIQLKFTPFIWKCVKEATLVSAILKKMLAFKI